MAGINVEKLLKHHKKALDFLQKIPTLENAQHEWKRKELIEILNNDMIDFEKVTKAPMSHLNEGDHEQAQGVDLTDLPGQPKAKMRRSPSKPFNFNKRLFKGELTIEIGENGEVIIKQGGGGDATGQDKSQKPPEPEPEVDFGEDDALYDDTATIPDEQEKVVEKPKNLGNKFGSFLKSKAKIRSPLPDRKKAIFSGKLLVKIGLLSKPTSKHCAIKQGYLYYGSAENTPSEGKIRLAGSSITELEGKGGSYPFELTVIEGDNYLLTAGTMDERADWIKQLKEARDGSKDRADSDAKASLVSSLERSASATKVKSGSVREVESLPCGAETSLPLIEEPEPEPDSFDQSVSALGNALEDALADEGEVVSEKRGWLKRVGNLSSHKVWVVVSGPQLTIYRDDKEQDVKEEYSIYGAKISTKGPTIKITMTDIKKGVALSPINKSTLPDTKWLQVLAKAIQAEEDIYEEYISPDTLGAGDASIKKGLGTSFRQTMKVGFSMFSRSEEVQGNPILAGTLWYKEPKSERYVQNYFTVVGDFLVHYRSKGDTQVLGRINLSKCYGMWLGPYGPMKNVLCLSHDGKKIHYFSISDLDEVGDWLETLGRTLLDSTWCSHYNDVTNQEVTPGVSVKQVYQAVYTHKSETQHELALDQGDMVHVTELSGNAWICEKLDKGMRHCGKAGYVTGSYLAAAYAAY
eukprot:TRINITY_DN3348_c0_g2_i1.p1 TRINITY_DN3348_c0_g2~~TRINITY_DN3348_c0_g2_i1.p1  ORF type:complete len:692 (+),score=170.42 TRINITY_DN3348_c0_g2_i1:34-2109(+)